MKETLRQAEEKMQKSVKSLQNNFASIRAGRATPAVLDKINVDYYGVPTPIQQMAAISVAEARVLVIQPWDVSTLKAIEKAIQASDLGITPNNEVGITLNSTSRRCDTVVYARDLTPLMIVEYKAPTVRIDRKVFDQIVRYNIVLQVPYLLVSNGMEHYCFRVDRTTRRCTPLQSVPAYDSLMPEP